MKVELAASATELQVTCKRKSRTKDKSKIFFVLKNGKGRES